MAQDLTTTGAGSIQAALQTPGVTPPPDRALNRAVSGAVKVLNDAGHAGQGREITFSVDRVSHLPVVRVVDTDTKEVVQQWPSDYVLQLAESYEQK